MKKRFIVAIDSNTKEQDEKFVSYLNQRNLAWWHWISNFWIITDDKGSIKASELRDIVRKAYFVENNLILELPDTIKNWAGYGPSTQKNNMFTWIKNNL